MERKNFEKWSENLFSDKRNNISGKNPYVSMDEFSESWMGSIF